MTYFYLPSPFYLEKEITDISHSVSSSPLSLKCFQGSLVLLNPGAVLAGPSLH